MMKTQGKKLSKKQKGWILSLGWIILISFLCLVNVDSVYMDNDYMFTWATHIKFSNFVTTGIIIGIIGGIILLIGSIQFLKKCNKDSLEPQFYDTWKIEIIFLLCIVAAITWFQGSYITYSVPMVQVWGSYYMPISIPTVTRYMVTQFASTAVIFGSVYYLIRQKMFGCWRNNSLICQAIKHYQQETPWGRRLNHRNRIGMLIIGILAALELIMVYNLYNYPWNPPFMIISVLTCIASVLVYGKFCFIGAFPKDLIHLLENLDNISQGNKAALEQPMREDSILKNAFEQLEHIEATMETTIAKQVQAERMRVDLVTNVSHDLKTPLTSMVGYTDLLKKEELTPAALDYVQVISQKQEQLKDMIQDLFELAKSTSNSQKLEMETLDMKKLIEQIMADMEDVISENDYDFCASFSEPELLFQGDNSKMYRVVQNLIENSLKYALPKTRVYIEGKKEEGNILLTIKNIAGYEMDFTAEEITERFARGDKSRSTQGHGLGLAIASSFTQNMGGEMQVAVDGDLFKVTLTFPESSKKKEGDGIEET